MSLVGVTATPATAAPASSFSHLNPGGQPRLTERVPVNVVFVGYEPAQVDRAEYLTGLARRYEPVVQSRLFYGITEKLGITYTYDYRVSYANTAYENRFFGELSRLARPAPRTDYQDRYNAQARNVLDVGQNHAIDAPSVERWLAFNPPAGVDTRRNTVYLINWYGRSDFKFHVYTKTDEPDPDTGYNFGAERDNRKMIAWGGTTADDEENGLGRTRRVWFHDLSAGPESWTANYDVTNADVDGDQVPDYRMPPTWEYVAGGYRSPAALAGDLSRITRYVALNLLMTTSPLYPVELPTPTPPRTIDIDSNTYEGWPGVDASERYVTPALLLDELSELRWRNRLSYDNQDLPFDARAEACYLGVLTGTPCYPGQDLPPAFANLYLHSLENLPRTQDDAGRVDYELPMFNYAVGEGVDAPFLGYADDDYVDGDQTFVYNIVSPEIAAAGYGLTTTMIHEVGHHVGLHHPHDGYDSERNLLYGAGGEFFYAWVGDESNSMMSYIDVNWDFSQFDRDNSDRFLAAAYNEAANRLAAAVLADPDAHRASGELRAADALLGVATVAFAAHQYRAAYAAADLAYGRVVAAARRVGVDPASVADETADSARRTSGPHESLIDSLTDGPRGRP